MASVLAPVESLALGALSQSTGSALVDAAIGGAAAYALAPRGAKARYALGGAVATGLTGVLGLVATLGFVWATQSDKRTKKRRRR
jgi:hypothetical protein